MDAAEILTPCHRLNTLVLALGRQKIADMINGDDDPDADWMPNDDDDDASGSDSDHGDTDENAPESNLISATALENMNLDDSSKIGSSSDGSDGGDDAFILNPATLIETFAEGLYGSLHRSVLIINMISRCMIYESLLDAHFEKNGNRWDVADTAFAAQFPHLAREARAMAANDTKIKPESSALDELRRIYSDDSDEDDTAGDSGFFAVDCISAHCIAFTPPNGTARCRTYPMVSTRIRIDHKDDAQSDDSDISVKRRPKRQKSQTRQRRRSTTKQNDE
jgi:hypothetical protein